MAVELATAYFSFLPSMAGTAAAAAPGFRALEVQSAASGARSGALMGGAVAGGLGKFIPIIGGVLAGIGIADFFGNAVDAASDLNESANAIRVSFGDASAEVAKLGETSALRLGLAENDFNGLAVRFSGFTDDLAVGGKTVAGVIDELTTRGADFASVFNIDVAEALAIFQSGLSGEAEPLKRYGINLLDSQVKAYAYAAGIAEVGTQLTESEKVQARYGLLLQETAKVQGDFANTSDQLANKQRINSALLSNALADIGTALLPAATAFATFVGSPENIARLERVVDAFIRAEPYISDFADFLITVADLSFDNLDTILAFFDAVEDGNLTLKETQDIFDAMPKALQNWTNTLGRAWANTLNFVVDAENTVLGGIATISNAIRGLLGIRGTIQLKVPRISYTPFTASVGGKKLAAQADGGRTIGAGWSWVGEKGPELAYMPVGARVLPNDISRAAVTGGGVRDVTIQGTDPNVVFAMLKQELGGKLATG